MGNTKRQIGYDMLYLSVCALQGTVPDQERIAAVDLAALYRMCRFHSLTSIVCMALESAGVSISAEWREAKNKAVRKNMLLDAERMKICGLFEKQHIWHVPLKGSLLQALYPKLGMREMADNDILYDVAYQNQVMEIMVQNGYDARSVGRGNHDVYMKPPVFNFEMHTALFGETHNEKFYLYYKDIRKKLVANREGSYGFHFTDEDFYLYMLTHTYKHYSNSGTGLRSLLDCAVYLRRKGDTMDWHYINAESEVLGFADFVQSFAALSLKICEDPVCATFTEEERTMLEYILFSGTYGTMENSISKKLAAYNSKFAKFKYIWNRVFPDMNIYKAGYPFFYKHKWLLPVGWAYRISRGLIRSGKRIFREFNLVRKQ